MKKLLIIDGNAILHRAFHAYPQTFSDKAGNPTNAIYGFYAMLLKVMGEVKPDLLTICFDQGAPTFRMNLYAGYHANRPKMQDTLGQQVEPLRESLEKIGIPLYAVDGYEADDLIGTLARQAVGNQESRIKNQEKKTRHSGLDPESSERILKQSMNQVQDKVQDDKGIEVIILSGDRDLLQLVNGHVRLLMPITGITKSVLMDSVAVKEKYGILPDQIIDYKALVGDPSDNYPGVRGIGPKTAANLLQQFGSIENLYKHLKEINPEIAKKLATDAEQAMLCKNLATIHTNVPIHLDVEKSSVDSLDIEKFLEVFDKFNIHSLVKRLGLALGGESIVIASEIKQFQTETFKNPSTSLRIKVNNKKKKPVRHAKGTSDNQLELL